MLPSSTRYHDLDGPDEQVLVVGDGNFSFSVALLELLQGGSSVTSTCYDSLEVLQNKYDDAQGHVDKLREGGASVLFQIDATRVAELPELDGPYDSIIFNFPHVGLGIKEQDDNIAANQDLIRKFLDSSSKILSPTGKVFVTIKKGEPYDSWKVARIGIAISGLQLKTAVDFDHAAFPGYSHRRTAGFGPSMPSEDPDIIRNGAKTFIFSSTSKSKKEDSDDEGKAKKNKTKSTLKKFNPKGSRGK
uniref:25S rRNA (uridine-N(3))-methyltransferase BMT5-like domain-containing protein n=1 Tax=Guillardia theta TaxID=55529 RepID=A0A7S4P2V0_GUITH|mmetsp:Transcript_42130/g.132715  ORF Transcript_42130/g.132715 Transcript_42130/m.132715 type:complete len:246 (+) Transcript_42130:277-1014(+)